MRLRLTDQFDFLDSLHEIHDKWYANKEPEEEADIEAEHTLFDIKEEIEKLERIVRKCLLESFLSHYYKEFEAR